MKKIITLTIAVILVMAFVFAFSACNAVEDAEELSFDTLPELVYDVGASDISNFAISIKKGDENTIIEYAKNKADITIEGFDTSTEGTRTARITYKGQTISFTYTVKANSVEVSPFASGAGTAENPYIIMNEEQFLALNTVDTEGKYYELGADVELKTSLNKSYVIEAPFKGTLSGGSAQRKLIVNKTASDKNELCVFFNLYNATIENMILDFNANTTVTFALSASKKVNFNNVDAQGNLYFDSNNSSIYLAYNFGYSKTWTINSSAQTTFENCDSSANITSTSYIGVFVAFPNLSSFNTGSNAGSIAFNHCSNSGKITAKSVGVLICNGTNSYMYNITVNDFVNNGTVRYTNIGNLVSGEGTGNSASYLAQYEAEVLTTNVRNSETGSVAQIATMTAGIESDKTVSFTAPETATSVKVVMSYYGNWVPGGTVLVQSIETIDVEGATPAKSELKVLDVIPMESDAITAGNYTAIDGYAWTIQSVDGKECYIHNNGVTNNSTLEGTKAAKNIRVDVFAFDANGNIVASAKVQ